MASSKKTHPSKRITTQQAATQHAAGGGRRSRAAQPRDLPADGPHFGQPAPSPDPTGFVTPVTDQGDYSQVDAKLLQPVPQPRGGATEPVLTFEEVLGPAGPARVAAITQAGQIVFHAVGDTGNVRGPDTQSLVADKMVADYSENDPADVPSFLYHLGDVVYNFGEAAYYYDQFYTPYRNYPAPILAIAGNHDGEVYRADAAPTLDAFLRNFCAPAPVHTAEAGGLVRTALTQPGVYFTLEAALVRIIGLYSNVLEDPGVISSQGQKASPVDERQLNFLTAALTRAKSFPGAVLVAVHHPPFTYGSVHSGSPRMLQDLDAASQKAGFWPHAYLAAHAHNYQRYTRSVAGLEIPYLVAGGGGHNVVRLQRGGQGGAVRTPVKVTPTLTFENYDDTDYGYLRVVVDTKTLRIEYHPASDGLAAKTPNDVVTVDLKTRAVS